jgi:hypothetical protein
VGIYQAPNLNFLKVAVILFLFVGSPAPLFPRTPWEGGNQNMRTISKDTTPATFAQNEHIQSLAAKINKSYTSKNSVQVMAAWGDLLLELRDAKDLKFVNRKGEAVTDGDPEENRLSTFKAICDEMECPYSSAYRYLDTAITVKHYPQTIQDAASAAGLNIAKPHIVKMYDEMKAKGTLAGKTKAQLDALSDLEAKGVVLELKTAKPPKTTNKTKTSESTGIERFEELLKEALDYARDDGDITSEAELVTLFGRVFGLTNKAKAAPELIRYCMSEAAKLHLTKDGFEVWQKVVTLLGQDEEKAKAAAAGAGAGAAAEAGDPFGTKDSVPADAKEAAKKP